MATELSEDQTKPPPRRAANNSNRKYRDPAYDDQTIEGLMSYFKFETYRELRGFLQRSKRY